MKVISILVALLMGTVTSSLFASGPEVIPSSSQMLRPALRMGPAPRARSYRLTFVDGALYTSILAYRTMDFFSTQPCLHSLYCGESELPTAIVATKPGFVAFEAGMAFGEIGSSCWLHRHGHGRLARSVDLFSVSAGTWSVVHNYGVRKYE